MRPRTATLTALQRAYDDRAEPEPDDDDDCAEPDDCADPDDHETE